MDIECGSPFERADVVATHQNGYSTPFGQLADGIERQPVCWRSRVPVVRAAAERLPFPDRTFDGAFLVAGLDLVDDLVATPRETRRVTCERVAVIALASGS